MKRKHAKPKWKKIASTGRVSVFRDPDNPNRYEVSWKKPNDSYGRRRFNAESIETAIEEAPMIAGLIPRPPLPEAGMNVSEAFKEALAMTKRQERSRKDWLREQVRFMKWLAKHHPDATHWQFITRQMIREYIRTQFVGCSPNRIRLAMNPVVQTSGYMSREYSLPHIAERLGIGSKLVKTPPIVYLVDVVMFLNWIHERNPQLERGAALQGLAGLQLQEALRLTWDKVDLERGLIEISGEVKNPYRNRVIPICGMLAEILRRAYEDGCSNEVVELRGPVVASPRGCSFVEGNSFRNYSLRLSKLFREWNNEITWAPKDLRNCILTHAVTEGLHSEVWEQYVGHSPRTITARHYIPRLAGATLGEKDALEKQMRSFKLHVIDPIDAAIRKIGSKNPSQILNFFEHEPTDDTADAEASQKREKPQTLVFAGLET